MPAKKKIEVEVEVNETLPVEAAVEVKENDKPILVAETEPEVKADTETTASQIFGPVAPEPPASNNKLFWILVIVFTLLGTAAGGVGIYLQNRGAPAPTPNPSPAIVANPTPTPAVELNREDLSVQVLNGSGITRAAATAADFLDKLGYTDVTVGNADSSDYSTTTIAIKDSRKAYLSLIKSDLEDKYTLTEKVKTLAEDSDFDVVITLGKE